MANIVLYLHSGSGMSENSKIEWTDATWNPLRGCKKVSPGCKHCYAETFAERFRGVLGHPYEQGFDLRLIPEKLLQPLTWSSAKTVFVNSMSDLFQQDVPDEFVIAVAKVMLACNWHTFQVLTKRSQRMSHMLNGQLRFASDAPHIWWGVSVEDRKYGLPRVQDLQRAPARTRFLSVEPLLEDICPLPLSGIHWVIVGGESGPGARPIHESWVQSLLQDCEAAKVPFFFKQWGGVQKKRNGRLLNGTTYDDTPSYVTNPVPSRKERMEIAVGLSHLLTGLPSYAESQIRCASPEDAKQSSVALLRMA